MCVFCAAIPVAAAAGVKLNNNQLHVEKQAEAVGAEPPKPKPIMKITASVVFLLVIGSVTYHSLTYFP